MKTKENNQEKKEFRKVSEDELKEVTGGGVKIGKGIGWEPGASGMVIACLMVAAPCPPGQTTDSFGCPCKQL